MPPRRNDASVGPVSPGAGATPGRETLPRFQADMLRPYAERELEAQDFWIAVEAAGVDAMHESTLGDGTRHGPREHQAE